MFVGNAKNSTNSVSKALGIFIIHFSWFERGKRKRGKKYLGV